jgi:subtilisin-like proprotein convertase family protein
VPQTIPDKGTTISTLVITDSLTIIDLNVSLSITHTRDSDLDVYLISPAGTKVELFTDVGGKGDSFVNTVLDDETDVAITSGSAPFSGSFAPEGDLSLFDGESVAGTWQLEVSDDRKRRAGSLVSWSIIVEHNSNVAAEITSLPSSDNEKTAAFEPQAAVSAASISVEHNPSDVNNDGYVTPIDVLLVIDALNQGTFDPTRSHLDVNGDNNLSPIDVLLVINELNAAAIQASAPLGQDVAAALAEAPVADSNQRDSVASEGEFGQLDRSHEYKTSVGSNSLPPSVAIYDDDLEDALSAIAEDIATVVDGEDRSLDDLFGELGEGP